MTNEQSMNKNEREKYLIEVRRQKVYELHAKGFSNTEISNMLSEHVSEPTVSRDLTAFRRQAIDFRKNHIETILPQEYEKTLLGLNAILKESWIMADKATNQREKHAALSLAKDCYSVRLDLLTNAGAINDAIDFVKRKQEKIENKENNASEDTFSDNDLELEESGTVKE